MTWSGQKRQGRTKIRMLSPLSDSQGRLRREGVDRAMQAEDRRFHPRSTYKRKDATFERERSLEEVFFACAGRKSANIGKKSAFCILN